ncbi:hypothetical protein M3649_19265 [Ureibacillus chungkukjangi]|uniref:hypothetical protein n=1 Tax=Ureibacillus chungkukjangi TaxID=1202712 RepID=UPI0020404CEF|nr:hypothetical protein [Ureibacillus chungkukjangi]MCM3390241.1 hypothetical protein [Ureibacillus chungkukjangi]
MIGVELFTRIKLLGIKSGVIELSYASSDFVPVILIEFYDEDTGYSYFLESVTLGEFCPTKESYKIGDFNLSRIKNSDDANLVKKLLVEKSKKMETDLVSKANEFAQEIRERAGITVKVLPKLKGSPEVATEYDLNMWHARQVLGGIYDDY